MLFFLHLKEIVLPLHLTKAIRLVWVRQNKYGAIAQLVEQRTENPCVPSSILGGTTLIRG